MRQTGSLGAALAHERPIVLSSRRRTVSGPQGSVIYRLCCLRPVFGCEVTTGWASRFGGAVRLLPLRWLDAGRMAPCVLIYRLVGCSSVSILWLGWLSLDCTDWFFRRRRWRRLFLACLLIGLCLMGRSGGKGIGRPLSSRPLLPPSIAKCLWPIPPGTAHRSAHKAKAARPDDAVPASYSELCCYEPDAVAFDVTQSEAKSLLLVVRHH